MGGSQRFPCEIAILDDASIGQVRVRARSES